MSFFDEASWVLIPEGIKEDVVYAQKPTNGLGDLTFTRASDATRTNSAGVIERTPWNLLTFSEDFSNAAWVKDNATISVNAALSPIGTLTADLIVPNTTSATDHRVRQVIPLISSFTYSAYVKYGGYEWVKIRSNTSWVNVNLLTGQVGFTSGVTATVSSLSDGWYRISMPTSTTALLQSVYIYPMNANENSIDPSAWSGNGTDGVYVWGAQLVEGTDAKPYFATTNRQDVPRLDYRNADGTVSTCPRLLLEPQRTNSIRNSTMVGAVAGSPGTLPTNWTQSGGGTLTQTIVGTGTESGIAYLDIRFNGIASTSLTRIILEPSGVIAGTVGQTFSWSNYLKFIANPSAPNSTRLRITERNSGGGALTQGDFTITPTTTLQRFAYTRANTEATCAFVNPELTFVTTIGATYDFTIRIAAPQMELGAYATTFIPTTTAAVTRLADSTFKAGLSSLFGTEGTWFIEMSPSSIGVSTTAFKKVIGLFQVNGSISDCIYLEEYIGTWGVFVRKGNATIVSRTYGTQPRKLAVTFGATGSRIYIDGVQAASTATNTSISPVQISTTQTSGSAIETVLNISQMSYFPTPLTQAQLAQLTTL